MFDVSRPDAMDVCGANGTLWVDLGGPFIQHSTVRIGGDDGHFQNASGGRAECRGLDVEDCESWLPGDSCQRWKCRLSSRNRWLRASSFWTSHVHDMWLGEHAALQPVKEPHKDDYGSEV